MSVLNLDKLLKPGAVALIGASNKEKSLGNVIMSNLVTAGFSGALLPVNPKYQTVCDLPCYPDIDSLPLAPDLGVICTPAATVPDLIRQLGEKGARAAVVITAGMREAGPDGETQEQKMLNAARDYGLRILGSNCIGIMSPGIGLNASFSHTHSLPGNLALISQSGALCTTILDWAKSRGIGFSHVISLGDGSDVDFGDLLDYLGSDRNTKSILLYIESIKEARKFISAARATARNKHVILIKAGRYAEGAKAAASHTGALAGNDEVFDAAIRRAGMLRVDTIGDLFAAAETLAHGKPVAGKRMVILTNGGGVGVLATDHLIARGGKLASINTATLNQLDSFLPANWSKANPIDIIGDSDAQRYEKAVSTLIQAPDYDALLILLVPSAVIDNQAVADAVAQQVRNTGKLVMTCWMGEDGVAQARDIFQRAGIPTYETPENAIQAFIQMAEYRENQLSLMEIPSSVPEDFIPKRQTVKQLFAQVIAQGREMLTEYEAKQVLAAYGIPIVETQRVENAEQAIRSAEQLGYPVALKVLSEDISHKSDVGGVILDIDSAEQLRAAVHSMNARLAANCPDARIAGFTVQPMVNKPHAQELIIGLAEDSIFGPVILFGEGGTAVEIINDKSISLLPLNMALAKQLINRTNVSKRLRGFRDVPAADIDAIALTLVKISQLAVDHKELLELDINPLYADHQGIVALDARIRVTGPQKTRRCLAIRPYPSELEERISISGDEILLRPIRPEDELAHQAFFRQLSPEDVYFRFFRAVNQFSHEQIARFTQIDYDREMAIVAVRKNADGKSETLGVVRVVADADNIEAEFAIIVRSDFHGRGLGSTLMSRMIDYSRQRGLKKLTGEALEGNSDIRELVKAFGFSSERLGYEKLIRFELALDNP